MKLPGLFLFILFTSFQLQAQSDQLVTGLKYSKIWGKKDLSEITMKLHFKCKIKPNEAVLRPDHPNSTELLMVFKGCAVNLWDFIKSSGIEDYGGLNEGFWVQIGEYDFDNDLNPEIVVAIGNGLDELSISVFKFHPPINAIDACKQENWELLGTFEGQSRAVINKGRIELPYGSAGLCTEWTFVHGKFVRTGNL